ncbi:hypothetical protein [Pararhizobium antarcticum]|uniref:Uncharacterized protein n=1 Tax=Pararhizobium antarcticum TaxID=1798805 RepID=A0A657LVV8_9HYPH|nr:hypothetical protein [Pararhizobium antarcticum]OJF91971.1 hypothetical protein AX761_05645 [Rhizobium sp. 58]OJF98354.1 hypothetical protein AX760_14705 [Pararhizobium antarcticum]
MPTTIPEPTTESPRGPQTTPGLPDRTQEKPATPPIIDSGDSKNPNDPVLNPALLPIGDPASMA